MKIEFDNALNEAGWVLVEELRKFGVVNGHMFNNIKPSLKLAIERYLSESYKTQPIQQQENQMNTNNLATQTQEEKEALDSIISKVTQDNSLARGLGGAMINVRNAIKGEVKTEHQEEMSALNDEPEWNGKGLPPVGAIYTTEPNFEIELLCKYSSKYVVVGEMLPKETYKGMEVVIDTMEQRDRIFRKPESPEEKEKRERLEAAYDLYLAFWSAMKPTVALESFEVFSCGGNSDLKHFLAVVDKTNYRKEK